MQCARALLPNPALPEALAESYRVRGMGSPSKSKELRAELLYCKWEHTKNVTFYHMHPGETLGFVRLQTEQKTATDDPGTSAGRDLLRSTVPPSTQSRYHQNHAPPGTSHWMILVLLCYRAVNSLLSMWECLHGKLWMREQNLSSPGLGSSLGQAKQHQWTVEQTDEESVPSQLLIISEKGAVVQRKWSQQSPGGGERAPPRLGPCWWHPSGCAGVLSSALTKESKQVI